MAHHAHTGGYATAGLVEQGKITQEQANAYNASVQAFKAEVFSWNPNSQEYFEQQSQQSLEQLGVSIDAFVDAAVAMVTITELNVRANEAAQAPDARESIALQDYMEDTDVLLSEDERTAYNEALQDVEDAAITAAAYTAIANDQELLDAADEAAYALNVTYEEAADSYFDSTTGQMTVEWLNGDASSVIALDVSGYWTTTRQLFNQAVNHSFGEAPRRALLVATARRTGGMLVWILNRSNFRWVTSVCAVSL